MAGGTPGMNCLSALSRWSCHSSPHTSIGEGELANQGTNLQDFYSLDLPNGFDGPAYFLTEVPPRNENALAQMSGDVFSRMVYENICPGKDVQQHGQSSVFER